MVVKDITRVFKASAEAKGADEVVVEAKSSKPHRVSVVSGGVNWYRQSFLVNKTIVLVVVVVVVEKRSQGVSVFVLD